MKKRSLVRIALSLLQFLLMPAFIIFVHAQESPVPSHVQYKLLLKVLELDRNFQPGNGDVVMIGIIYQRKFRPSLKVQQEMTDLIQKSEQQTETGLRLRSVMIDLLDDTDLKAAIQQYNVQILYIAPLRSFSLDQITSISRTAKTRTFTGVPEYASHGVAITIGLKGDKPLIIVNLRAAKAEGSNYSSQLLGLAQVIE